MEGWVQFCKKVTSRRRRRSRPALSLRFSFSLFTGCLLLVVVILTAPTIPVLPQLLSAGGGDDSGIGGVFAAPCPDTLAGVPGKAQNVTVTPDTDVDLSTIFSCEDGEFEVSWSGVVNVSRTIYIGRGTTVKIVGDATNDNSSTTARTGSNYSSNFGGTGSASSGTAGGFDQQLIELPSGLPLPSGLSSAAVGTHPPNTAADDNTSFGPIFFVDGGQLSLEGLAVRDGFSTNSTESLIMSGGGVHAIDSNVTVTGCEFEDSFAKYQGGGIYTSRSTLVVLGSVFRRCQAGFQSFAGDENADGAGGGIGVRCRLRAYALVWLRTHASL